MWLIEHIDTIFNVATATVTFASAIAAVTPTTKDDAIVAKVRGVIDFLALNILHAKR